MRPWGSMVLLGLAGTGCSEALTPSTEDGGPQARADARADGGAGRPDSSLETDAGAADAGPARSPATYCPNIEVPAERPADGTPLPASVLAAARAAYNGIAPAQASGDDAALRDAVCRARSELGAWQGVSEAPGVYFDEGRDPLDAEAIAPDFTTAVLLAIWDAAWQRANFSTNGEDLDVALRTPCGLVRALAWTSRVAPAEDASALRTAAQTGGRWLLSVQRPGGQFGFPDLSDDAEAWLRRCESSGRSTQQCIDDLPRLLELALRGKAEWERQGRPEGVLVDGWFVDLEQLDPGGLQFDTGDCGRALLDLYAAFGDEAYLDAARAAGAWATDQVPVDNWNYNAFSVGLLARLAVEDPHPPQDWAAAALRKAELGVLPGLMSDGRWFDPHNARIVYHMILLRSLAHLAEAVRSDWVDTSLDVALQRSVDELETNGATALDDGLEAHLQIERLGLDQGDALRILLRGAWRDGTPQSAMLARWLATELE